MRGGGGVIEDFLEALGEIRHLAVGAPETQTHVTTTRCRSRAVPVVRHQLVGERAHGAEPLGVTAGFEHRQLGFHQPRQIAGGCARIFRLSAPPAALVAVAATEGAKEFAGYFEELRVAGLGAGGGEHGVPFEYDLVVATGGHTLLSSGVESGTNRN